MRFARLLIVAAVVAAVTGLVIYLPGTSEPRPASVDRAPVPAAQSDGSVNATWYCAASTALAPSAPAHTVILTNPSEDDVTVRATPYSAEGPGSAAEIDVPAGQPVEVDVATQFGDPARSVVVESPEGSLVVAHRLTYDGGADEVPCAAGASGSWWFPALSTIRGAGAQLTLFNPFSADAGVDVEVYLDTGVRQPRELSGIIVPAGTVRVVNLGELVQRRDQFAAVVKLRSGRVVAEATQTFDPSTGVEGLRMNLGVPAPAERWAFAGGFTGAGASEALVFVNPSEETRRALVQVTPYGGAATAPEPLEVEVPALRYQVVDLSAESRIPASGYHSILVDSPDAPLVVARTTAITAGLPEETEGDPVSNRPDLSSGVAIATGTPVGSGDWIVPSLSPATEPAPVVLVHNPNEGIAVVSVAVIGADGAADPASEVEVQPLDSVPVSIPTAAGARVAVRVSSMSPVVVEQLQPFPEQGDLAFGLAVPVRADRRGLVTLGSG